MTDGFRTKINVKRLDADLQKLASNFSCGNDSIDLFLKSALALDCSAGTTYVWLVEDESEIIGYYNFTTGSLDSLDYDMRVKSGGAIHLNEFAIAEKYHGAIQGTNHLSDILLDDFVSRVSYIREHQVGFSFITLRSTDMGYSLYRRNDFEEVEEDMDFSPTEGKDSDGGTMMYLPLALDVFSAR